MYIRSYLSNLSFRCIYVFVCVCVCAQLLQSCLTFCYLMDGSLPASSVHGILQASILESIVIFSSRDLYVYIVANHWYIRCFFTFETTKTEETSLYPSKGALGGTLPGKYLEKSNIINQSLSDSVFNVESSENSIEISFTFLPVAALIWGRYLEPS